MQIPEEINYGNFKPKGYYTTFKQWPITPLSSNQYWTPDQIVRFLVTIKSGVMDPYRSHIELQVSTTPQSSPVGSLQVDSSAQSFIAQTVISSNNVQIQRITEYDTLACYLTDIGFSQYVCESRQIQGLGYSNISSHQPYSTGQTSSGQYTYSSQIQAETNYTYTQNSAASIVMPTRMALWAGKGQTANSAFNSEVFSNYNVGGTCSVTPSLSNMLWQPSTTPVNMQQILNICGRFNNIRAQYASSILDSDYPDVSSSYLHSSPYVSGQTYQYSQMTANNNQSGFNSKAPYQINIPQQTQTVSQINMANGNNTPVTYPTTCNLMGYQKPISSQFARGTKECFISATVPQCQMQNGLILPAKIPVLSQLYRIPLLSTVCGILIPPDQFLLIPMQAMYNILLQITLSRFAMFTSGYCDVHQFDQKGMQTMQMRKWLVSQIYWNIHLYTFNDEQINKQIQASLVKSIPVSSTSYVLASQYQMPNGQVVRNGWPIATQAESLCQVICLFLSNQYQQYSFCRKQFRLSNCISSMQIKLNTQFFPSQPITGNAGNPQTLDTSGDNWPFYQQILLSSNFMFNTNIPCPKINMKNFAINGRCYNVKNTATYWDPNMNNNWQYKFTTNSVNSDTAMGMSSFHENRYVGKAAFVYTWQPYGHSKNYMTGINTQGTQNMTITFNTVNTSPFPSDETLLIFTRQNVIVVYGVDGIRVIGK